MNSITSKLERRLATHPASLALRNALLHLKVLDKSSGDALLTAWNALVHDFELLEAEGLWNKFEEDSNLLDDLRTSIDFQKGSALSKPSATGSSLSLSEANRGKSIVQPLPNHVVFPNVTLPLELFDSLNQAYFLHLLATDPPKVLPPGKSLLSMMSRPHTEPEHDEGSLPSLQEKVEDIAQRAFWDEARDSLSNPAPSSQLPRLKLLYKDLHTALTPLLPPTNPILVTLSSHLSPTPSPLWSAVFHLREVLSALRARCAPARDAYIDSLSHTLQELPSPYPVTSDLAKIVVDIIESIIKLSKAMKDDLSQFVLGAMNEKQLQAVITQRARVDERKIVLELWRPEQIQQCWAQWLAELQPDTTVSADTVWIHRLIQALRSSTPVSSSIPRTPILSSVRQNDDCNILPPPFFLSTSEILYIQNFLQAIVIAAALRSLTRLPPLPGHGGSDFMERIWTLLRVEIDEGEGSGDTKVVNLADEVLRARNQTTAAADVVEETRLRAAVERTLQPSDPVFNLLQKRLLTSMVSRLRRPTLESRPPPMSAAVHMRTGREGERVGKKSRIMLDAHDLGLDASDSLRAESAQKEDVLVVKGFEDPVLVKAVGEALGRTRGCLNWVTSVWEDVIANSDTRSLEEEVGRVKVCQH